MSDITLSSFDAWLKDRGPAALVIREHLMPVEGHDGVLFPPTFAATEDKSFKGGYNIDQHGDSSVCLVDSVGAQANRIEPIFALEDYKSLVPQIEVTAGKRAVNLLEAGHRAGDAIVRCSSLKEDLQKAFHADQDGNARPLAMIAPTSFVFGVWDSRDTQCKRPRLVASTIRAYDVQSLHRSAVYNRTLEYDDKDNELLSKDLLEKAGAGDKRADSKSGFANALASWSHGGVIAKGGVRRDATLHLAALRLVRVKGDAAATLELQRYILGLALTAFTFSPPGYLRQGCNLVPDPDRPRELKTVHGDGKRDDAAVPGAKTPLTHDVALVYAKLAAKAFGVGEDRTVPFDTEAAKRDLAGDEGKKAAAAKKEEKKSAKKEEKGAGA